jgi:AraC-like DNA-binding protein
MAKEFADGATSGKHHHLRAQLLYCVSGVMEVLTTRAMWLVPPQRAVWLPSNVEHEMRCRGHVSLRTVYVRPDAIPGAFPLTPTVVQVSPLLRELILRAVAMPQLYEEDGRDGRIVDLMLQEFRWEPASLLMMEQPDDKRLDRIYRHLLKVPHSDLTIEDWARRLDISSRTLTRLFKFETGTSFVCWRQQIRLLAALPRLAIGEPVIDVALAVGYDTPSAFAAMFRKFTGTTPARYFL